MSLYEIKACVRGALIRSGLVMQSKKDRKALLLDKYDIDVVFDVGANNGQYGRQLMSMGWTKPLVSFEPLSSAMPKLRANAQAFPNWTVENLALGARDGKATINISGNSQSSSLRDMLPAHVKAAPQSAYVGTEEVELARFDSIIDRYAAPDARCFLKLDVQGFERDVLEGTAGCLDRVVGLQAEMAVTPLYDGETLFPEMVEYLADHGFSLMWIGGVFADSVTGQTMQLEGVFYRETELQRLRQAA